MKVRRYVQCDTTLPDDHVENEHDVIRPAGRNVAEAMMEILSGLGCEGYWEADRRGDEQWEFSFAYGPVKIHCIVSIIYDCVFFFEDESWIRSWFKTVHPFYLELLQKIAEALPKDPRFSNVRWYSDEDAVSDRPGAAGPVD